MLLKTAIDDLIGRVGLKDKENADTRAIALTKFNFSFAAFWKATNWNFRYKSAQLVLIPNITGTGTWTVFDGTNEDVSRAINVGSHAGKWNGRYFQPTGADNWYRIQDDDGTTLTLDAPVLESGTTFTVWKRLYQLCSDCETLLNLYPFNGESVKEYRPSQKLVGDYSSLATESVPLKYSEYGVDNYQDLVYSTGTVTGTEGSDMLTGTATAFVGNVGMGDIITIDDNEYVIKRVEGQILKLYTHLLFAVTGGTFSIRKNNPLSISLYPNTDAFRILNYDYISKPYHFTNETYDDIPFDRNTIDCILKRAEAEWLAKNDEWNNYTIALNVYEARLSGLKANKNAVKSTFSKFEPLISPAMPGRY